MAGASLGQLTHRSPFLPCSKQYLSLPDPTHRPTCRTGLLTSQVNRPLSFFKKINFFIFIYFIIFKFYYLKSIDGLFYFIFWLCMRDLSSPTRPGIEPRPPALGVRSLNRWTAREVLPSFLLP